MATSATAVKTRSQKPREITREPDYSQLSPEDHAELVENQFDLRGNIKCLDGKLTSVRGAMMRSNSLLNLRRAKQRLQEMQKEIAIALVNIRKLELES